MKRMSLPLITVLLVSVPLLWVPAVAQNATPAPTGSALAPAPEPAERASDTESAPSGPPERVVWNRVPIRVVLPVGQERLVSFPGSVQVGLPPAVASKVRTLSNQGTVYWLAREAFPPARVQVVEVDSGHHYLIDLEAREEASAVPMEVMWGDDAPAALADAGLPATPRGSRRGSGTGRGTPPLAGGSGRTGGGGGAAGPASDGPSLDYVTLTRFAAQNLYGPERLIHSLPGVHRVPLGRRPLGELVRGGQVEAEPLIGWRGGGYYLTVVKLTNRTADPVVLDPRWIRGAWLTAAFQHARLLPRGDVADSTSLYLISARPFAEAVRGVH